MNRALLVDDEKDICDLLSVMLRKSGTECSKALSLKDGRKALREETFDAIFLDVNLPDGLGYELIADIRELQPNAHVIAISAMDQEGSNAVKAGADIFVPKPFDRSAIYSSIEQLGFTVTKKRS